LGDGRVWPLAWWSDCRRCNKETNHGSTGNDRRADGAPGPGRQGVEHVFGYPGGAVLPIYDELFKQNSLRHILVRHEQGAVHAAEGYARSTGKVGVVLVTPARAPPTPSPA